LWILLGIAGATLFLFGLANHGLWGAQEPYVGGIIREMADSGDWVVPTLNGAPYLEKPPLYYLVGALVARVAHSFSPWVLRLPSALFALGTMAWIAWLACRRQSPAAGWWAAFCLGTSDLFFRVGHMALVDMALAFAVSLGLGCAWLAFAEPERVDRWANGVGVSLGLSFLAKGLLGPLLILLPLGATLALPDGRRFLGRLLKPRWGWACGLLLGLGWIVLLYARGGRPCLEEAMIRNTLGRFLQSSRWTPRTGAPGEHREHALFYLTHSPFNLLPWLFLAGTAVIASLRAFRPGGRRAADLFLPLALVLDTLLLSVSRMRRATYFLPLIPIIFLQTGLWLDRRIRTAEAAARPGDRGLAVLLGITGTGVLLAALAGPWLLVREYRIPWAGPLAFSAAVAVLGWVGGVALGRKGYRLALDTLLLVWGGGLLWLVFVFPVLRDPELRRVEGPFRLVRQYARVTGAEIHEYALAEADLGMASLIVRRPMAPVDSLDALGRVLAQGGPRIVLAPPGAPECDLAARFRGHVLQPERPRCGQQGTGLLLILNEAAWRALPPAWSGLPAQPRP
jgi:4-amino-4-deoxy-L-arabinose transferase-like glycosyltransferase